MLLSFLPQALCSGLLGIMMSVYSHVSAVTEPDFRTIKFAIIEAIIFVGNLSKSQIIYFQIFIQEFDLQPLLWVSSLVET